MSESPETTVVHRTCPFCEATCGLRVHVAGEAITRVEGDPDDPFSRGFVCPKAWGLKELHHDPDRLTHPLRRTASGWEEISWDDAYALCAEKFAAIREAHGNDAIGTYTGNPMVHDLGALLYRPVLARALDSKSRFNSAAIDTLPKIVQTGLMFGRPFPTAVPVPDIDRTRHLLVIGANPAVSHGSLMTMPDAPGRLRAVAERGKLVVVDPRRSETAKLASEHHFIRPGSDAAFLLAMVHTLFEEDLARLGAAEGRVAGLEEVAKVAAEFAPERVAGFCGIDAAEIRRLAREFAAAESAACYGRLGTCVQEFGTLASWGCDLLNLLTGNLDRPGGVMFTTPAAPIDAALPKGRGFTFGRWRSRVSGQPEVDGLIPSSTMGEEILTPGEGQVRAMLLMMTNPLRSAANSAQLERAFASLDFLVAIDFYLNETTRHADLILPTPAPSEQENYEVGLYLLSVRNVAKWSPAVVPASPDRPQTWQVFSRLARDLMGLGALSEQAFDDIVLRQYATAATEDGALEGLDADEVLAAVEGGIGSRRLVDMLLRIGPHGDGFGRRPGGLTLAKLEALEHGLDLGPLEPRLDTVVNTESGAIEACPQPMVDDLPRLRARMAAEGNGELILIGRRDMRATNSFMHNLPALVKGRDRCTLQVSPADAGRLGLEANGRARVISRVGSIEAPVEITDDLMPGVVSLPHGWGHDDEASGQRVAKAHPGVNANRLTDDRLYDQASGTAVLFGTPVTVERAG